MGEGERIKQNQTGKMYTLLKQMNIKQQQKVILNQQININQTLLSNINHLRISNPAKNVGKK